MALAQGRWNRLGESLSNAFFPSVLSSLSPHRTTGVPKPGPPGDDGLEQHSPRLLGLHTLCVQQMLPPTPSIAHEGLSVSARLPEMEGRQSGQN